MNTKPSDSNKESNQASSKEDEQYLDASYEDELTAKSNARFMREMTSWFLWIVLFLIPIPFVTLIHPVDISAMWRVYVQGVKPVLKVEPLGEVRRVSYVGGNWPDTQVDTTTHSLLLQGVIRLRLNETLELRSQDLEPTQVCVVGTKECMKLRE